MRRFAALLDALAFTPQRTGKLTLLKRYFAEAPDPDRGFGLAAITRDLELKTVKPAMLRALAAERTDEVLFARSYDYVGDLAETIALIWGEAADDAPDDVPALHEVVTRLNALSRAEAPGEIARLLDRMAPPERYALMKLATGGMRVGVSARLAKLALADFGDVDVTEIEELWHGLSPPYAGLFAWLEGRAEKPAQAARAPFRPVMLATPLEEAELAARDPSEHLAEWKWDGIRVQASAEGGMRRLYSRSGDDISRAFPDLVGAMDFEGTLDGELLVIREGAADRVGTFSELQQRLNRKTVSAKLLASHPVFLRAYDLLLWEGEDLRARPFEDRRRRLEAAVAGLDARRIDLSPFIPFESWETLAALRAAPPHPAIEGLMLKRRDSAYVPGRPKGPWFKWKKDPMVIDAVLLYAQRGHGKRSSYYSDYTFGVWRGEALVPVGKAYFGFTDAELRQLDTYIRENTIERYGPVRAVRAEPGHGLVLEVAFEGLQRSTRHKSGLAMRFPRISRLRWDKPPHEADRIEALEALIAEGERANLGDDAGPSGR